MQPALSCVLLLVGCSPHTFPPAPDGGPPRLPRWTKLTSGEGPEARAGAGLVYDSARKRVVLFGGRQPVPDHYFDDTWSWDGTKWTNLQTAHHPQARVAPAMVYDAARDRIVLFGGAPATAGTLGDTWEFDGTDWQEAHPATSPRPRVNPASAWDAARQRTVVFGGWAAQTAGDTWEYDGITWREISAAGGPTGAAYPIATYDPSTARVAMLTDEVVNQQVVSHLWRFDGDVWEEQRLAVMPDSPGQTALATHPRYGLVQYGGIGKTGLLWTFDGTLPSVSTLSPAPAGVNSQGMVGDPEHDRMLLFGGYGDDGLAHGELWALE